MTMRDKRLLAHDRTRVSMAADLIKYCQTPTHFDAVAAEELRATR